MLNLDINTNTTGFVSPAEIYVDKRLDLNDLLIKNIHSTFYFKYMGNDIFDIQKGQILVVDRSLIPKEGDLVVIYQDDKFRLNKYDNNMSLFGKITWILKEII